MKKLNFKIISTNIAAHYVAIFIAAVAGYWLIYWVTMWGLFGIANVSKSESVMNWLADNNYFYPARESELSHYYRSRCKESPIQTDANIGTIEKGLEYLKRGVWIKDEMESFQCLAGLYDELNEFDLVGIKARNELVERSPELREIVNALENCNIESLRKPYNREEDIRITPRNYLKYCKKPTQIHKKESISSEEKGTKTTYKPTYEIPYEESKKESPEFSESDQTLR
ncbi:MAG: hypothetical protein K2K98_00225 [Muribaculaceae bacterium]|nr:hypothetical protein [Muribaculaceae bacterium]